MGGFVGGLEAAAGVVVTAVVLVVVVVVEAGTCIAVADGVKLYCGYCDTTIDCADGTVNMDCCVGKTMDGACGT